MLLACLAAVLGGCLPEEATAPGAVQTRADAEADAEVGEADAAMDAQVADADAAADAFIPVVELVCPGAPGCRFDPNQTLRAGAAAQRISVVGFERPRIEYLKPNDCNELQPGGRCGELTDDALDNCGTDRLCPDDMGYEGPDADGTEGDLAADGTPAYDYFFDCGLDGLCPGDAGYAGPDEGEGDGRFQGLWLAGFGTNRPALAVRDHTWARTVALQQGGTTVTLTVLDAVGLFYDDVQRIREQALALLAAEAPEISVDFIMVSSTHSHEVPDTLGQWGGETNGLPSKTGIVPRYIESLRAQAARSIVDALLDLRPAQLRVGAAATGVEGFIRDSRAPYIYDDTLGVAQLVDPMGATIATLVNWGNHPEAMGSDNNMITSDFPGALRTAIEDGLPGKPGAGGVAIFIQGMVGGLMTPLGVPVRGADGTLLPEPTFARTDAIGQRLAGMALDALATAEEVEAPALQVASGSYVLPVENRIFQLAYLLGLLNRRLVAYDDSRTPGPGNIPRVVTQTAVIVLGPLTLYSVPGELFPEVAVGGYDGSRSFGRPVVPEDPLAPDLAAAPGPPYLHDLMPGRYRWVIGLGLDELGYMVPPYDFKVNPALPYLSEAEGDHYEETNSVGPAMVPRTVAVLTALARALSP